MYVVDTQVGGGYKGGTTSKSQKTPSQIQREDMQKIAKQENVAYKSDPAHFYNQFSGGSSSSSSSGHSSSGGGSSKPTYIPIEQTKAYQDLLSYFEEQNHSAMNSALDAISSRLSAIKGQYSNALKDSDAEFQKLINANEVNKYRSARAIREALANRGQLNTGLGRQEALSTDIKYGNTQANLLAERQKARNDINNLIIQAEAEAEADKANAKTQFANALAQYKLQLGA